MSPIFIEVTLFASKRKRSINMARVDEFGPSLLPNNQGGCYLLREGGGIEVTESYDAIKRAASSYSLGEE